MLQRRWRSHCRQLARDLDEIAALMMELLDCSKIQNIDPNRGQSEVFFVGAATWGWQKSDDIQTRLQMQGLERYGDWFASFSLLFQHPTRDVRERIETADRSLRKWFERGQNDTTVPRTIDEAKDQARAWFGTFRRLLEIQCAGDDGNLSIIAVPDTNALIDNPDLASYEAVLGQESYRVRLVPTVLGELDELKRGGRTETLREAASRAGRMLKGLRDRGDVRVGAPVTKQVSAAFDVAEPRFENVPDWLDPGIPDDRLLASALLIQSSEPSSVVVIVTSDLNLQTKAAALRLPYVEPPSS
jgi:rRNA maturation endonuclease Nob1